MDLSLSTTTTTSSTITITDAVAVDTILSCKSMEIVDNEIHPSIDSVLRLTSAFYLRIRTIPNCGTVSSPTSIFNFDDDDDDDEKHCPSNVILQR